MKSSIRNVVFDIGNVFIEWDPRNLYRKLFGSDVETMEWFIANVCTHDWNRTLDEGRLFADAVYELVVEYPDFKPHIEAYDKRWDEMLGNVITGTVDVLKELKAKNIPVFGLTNWSAEKFPYGKKHVPELALFDGVVVSGDVKLIKPDIRIYQYLTERFVLKPEETFFTDDVAVNVEAARRAGWDAVLFTSPEKLRADLVARSLLP